MTKLELFQILQPLEYQMCKSHTYCKIMHSLELSYFFKELLEDFFDDS